MQREIKFRAFVKPTKTILICQGFCYESDTVIRLWFKLGPNFLNESFYIGDIDLIEYTGLKDKNSKEMYEGDMVSFSDIDGQKIVSKIIFKYGRFQVTSTIECYPDQMEIIGNIYEHPHLLTT